MSIKKKERSQISNLTSHLKEVEKQTKPKVKRRKEITKIRAEIENRRTIEKISKTNSWFFEKINKIDKSLARFTMRKER